MNTTNTIHILKEYLTVSDVKRCLNISQSAAYELIHSTNFPVCRIGGSIRIPKRPFLAWLDMCTNISTQLNAYMSSHKEA